MTLVMRYAQLHVNFGMVSQMKTKLAGYGDLKKTIAVMVFYAGRDTNI